jgi:hypothetical protein
VKHKNGHKQMVKQIGLSRFSACIFAVRVLFKKKETA